MRKLFVLLLFSLMSCISWSQENKTSSVVDSRHEGKKKKHKLKLKVKPDTLYVRDYDDLLSIDLPFASTFLTVDLTDKLTKKVMNYRPHSDMTVGLEAGFKVIGLGYGVSSGLSSYGDKVLGKTTYSDYFFSFSGHRFVLDMYYEDFKGFYLSNYTSFPKTSPADTSKIYPQRSDMHAASMGLNFYYIQNYKKFSYKAAFSNSEEQLKSAGSFMWGGYISGFSLSADSGLVFGKYKHSLAGYANIDNSVTLNTGISAGYMYTFVIKHHFYATIAINPGISYMYYTSHAYGPHDTVNLHTDSTYSVKSTANLGFKIQSRISVGYNSPKLYAGLVFAGDAFYQDEAVSRSKVDYAIGSFRVYVGYRFNVPYLNKIWPQKSPGQRVNFEGTGG